MVWGPHSPYTLVALGQTTFSQGPDMPLFQNLKPLLKGYEGAITRIIIPVNSGFVVNQKFRIDATDSSGRVFRWRGVVKAVVQKPNLLKLRLKCKKGVPRPSDSLTLASATVRPAITDEDVIDLTVTVTIENNDPIDDVLINAILTLEEPEYPLDPDDL